MVDDTGPDRSLPSRRDLRQGREPEPDGIDALLGGQPQPAARRPLFPDLEDEAPAPARAAAGPRRGTADPLASGRPPRRRGRRALTVTIVLVVLVGLLGGGAALLWATFGDRIQESLGLVEDDYSGEGEGEVLVVIEPGQLGDDIARTLADEGVVMTSQAFYELLLAQDPEPVFHPGVYRLAQRMSSQAALDALLDPANRVENTATIPEGSTGEQTIALLAEATGIPLADFEAAVADPSAYGLPADAPSMEGWLFPSTYTFDPRLSAADIVGQLVAQTVAVLDARGVPVEDRERILTIASIVQSEARRSDDFYRISRVIANRLDAGMNLEMDSTSQYGVGAGKESVWSTDEALGDDNPWNTYVHPGLPVGPISNPGELAIDAALNPAEGPWIFFATVNLDTGETVFSETIGEHEAAVAQLTEWCAANPGRGC